MGRFLNNKEPYDKYKTVMNNPRSVVCALTDNQLSNYWVSSGKYDSYSAMVVYGLLTYENGMVFIPNKELMGSYAAMMKKEQSLGYIYRLANVSSQMLQATLAGDTETMEKIIQYAHNTEVPIK